MNVNFPTSSYDESLELLEKTIEEKYLEEKKHIDSLREDQKLSHEHEREFLNEAVVEHDFILEEEKNRFDAEMLMKNQESERKIRAQEKILSDRKHAFEVELERQKLEVKALEQGPKPALNAVQQASIPEKKNEGKFGSNFGKSFGKKEF